MNLKEFQNRAEGKFIQKLKWKGSLIFTESGFENVVEKQITFIDLFDGTFYCVQDIIIDVKIILSN